jgi:predicted TIM-barrel fold metal-dependent hydrolase
MSYESAISGHKLPIVDAHVHLYDGNANNHSFLNQKDEFYEALVGDYSALPRSYLLDGYLKDTDSRRVEGIVWHEYLSDDPVKEIRWGQRLAGTSPVPQVMVALVDFLDSRLEERLDIYRSLPNVTAVREHLGWDATNPKRRFAKRPDLLTDPLWQRGLSLLRRYNFKCGLEVFSPQIPDLLKVVRLHPDLGFTIAVLGWPLDLTTAGYGKWHQGLKELSQCENVCADISAIECIFGLDWRSDGVAPWVLSLVEMFGPKRCMFGSHLPISKLSFGFEPLYDAYQQIVAEFSHDEKDHMFRKVATDWFAIPQIEESRTNP